MFKKAVVTLSSAIMFACSPAHAQQIPIVPMDCTTMAEIAEITMQSRQVGVPMREVHKLAMDSENKEFAEWATKIVKIVYASPRYSTKEHQKRAADEFGSDVYLACLKAGKLK